MKHPNISFLGFKEGMLSVAIHSFKKTKLKHFIGFEAMCPSITHQSTSLWQGGYPISMVIEFLIMF
jgi:hypothetical protein